MKTYGITTTIIVMLSAFAWIAAKHTEGLVGEAAAAWAGVPMCCHQDGPDGMICKKSQGQCDGILVNAITTNSCIIPMVCSNGAAWPECQEIKSVP